MKVLIVGGAGMLGRHVADALAGNCVVYDRLLYADEYLEPHEFIYGDVRDQPKLLEALSGASVVVWLAAVVGDAACMADPSESIAVNRNAVGFLAAHYDGPIIFASSCSVYGVSGGIAYETSPLAPQSLYAESKIDAEKLLADKRALILRLGTLHGTSGRMRFDLAVNALTMRAVTRGCMDVYGGKQYRPFLAVQDAAAVIAKACDSAWTPGVYNLASQNMSIHELARSVQSRTQAEIHVVASKFEDNRDYQVSSSVARHLLDFSPAHDVDDSIDDIATLLSSGRIKDPDSPRYNNALAMRLSHGCAKTD